MVGFHGWEECVNRPYGRLMMMKGRSDTGLERKWDGTDFLVNAF